MDSTPRPRLVARAGDVYLAVQNSTFALYRYERKITSPLQELELACDAVITVSLIGMHAGALANYFTEVLNEQTFLKVY